MAYKFKKWRIRWNKPARKFKKIRRDRKKSEKLTTDLFGIEAK